jgi:hypothetical protein
MRIGVANGPCKPLKSLARLSAEKAGKPADAAGISGAAPGHHLSASSDSRIVSLCMLLRSCVSVVATALHPKYQIEILADFGRYVQPPGGVLDRPPTPGPGVARDPSKMQLLKTKGISLPPTSQTIELSYFLRIAREGLDEEGEPKTPRRSQLRPMPIMLSSNLRIAEK